MASLRERFSVRWNDGEPVTITTTVQDMITALDMLPKGQNQNQIAIQTALIYCALRREGHDVPSYPDWLLLIDEYSALPTAVVIEGPTQETAFPQEPLLSHSSPVPTGDHGQNAQTIDPSLPQSSFS